MDPTSTAAPRSKALSLILRVVLAILLLGAVLWLADPRAVISSFTRIHRLPLAGLVVTAVLDRLLMAYKWNLLLRARGVRISHGQAIRLVFVGVLLGAVTPGGLGGEAYKIAALAGSGRAPVVVSTIVIERFLGLVVIGLFAVSGLPYSAWLLGANSTLAAWSTVAVTLAAIGGLLVSLQPSLVRRLARVAPRLSELPIVRKFAGFYMALADFRRHIGVLLLFTLLTALELMLLVSIHYFAAKALGVGLSFGFWLAVVPLVHIVARLPITFQGIGVIEGLLAYMLRAAGLPSADGVAIGLLLRVVEVLVLFAPAAVMLSFGSLRATPEPGPTE